MAVVEAFELGVLGLPDFYFTGDDYRYRFAPGAKQRFLELLRERFNSGVKYRDRVLKWDTVIEQKTSELGRYMVGRSDGLDFSEPSPRLGRADEREFRERIQNLSLADARKRGIGKSTSHYLRRNAGSKASFRRYTGTMDKLMSDAR